MQSGTSRGQRSAPGQRRWIAAGLIASAVVVSAHTLFRELRSRDFPDTRVLLASAAAVEPLSLDTLVGGPIWAATIGHGEGTLASDATAVRLGAAIAELELRRLRSDSTTTALAANIIQLLQTVPGSEDAVRAYQSLGTPPDEESLRSAAAIAERVSGRRAVRLGAWLQSARYAAATGDSSVFGRETVRRVSEAAVTSDARPETEYAARQLEIIAGQRPRDWTALATAINELLRRLGTR